MIIFFKKFIILILLLVVFISGGIFVYQKYYPRTKEPLREQVEKPKLTEEPLSLKEISLDEAEMDFEEIVKKIFPDKKFIPYKPEVFHQNKKAICLEQIFKEEQNLTEEEGNEKYLCLEKILEGSFVEINSKNLFVIIRTGYGPPESNEPFPSTSHVGGFYHSIIGIFDKDTKNHLAKERFGAYNEGYFNFYNCKKERKIYFTFREFGAQQGWFATTINLYKIENKEFKKIEINEESDWLIIKDSKNKLSFFEGVSEFLIPNEVFDEWERKEKAGLISYRLRGNVHLYDYIWDENKCLFEKYDETPNLKTYQNEKYKFAIDFPMDWSWIDDYGIEIFLLENVNPECNNLSWQEIINDFSKCSSLSENSNISFIIQKLNFKKEFFSRFNKKGYEIEGNFGVCIKCDECKPCMKETPHYGKDFCEEVDKDCKGRFETCKEYERNCKERLRKNSETKIKGVLFPLIEEENKKSGVLIFYYENILEDENYFNQIINSFRQY